MSAVESAVVWLGEALGSEARLVGPKAAMLSGVYSRHAVPDGFCLTAAAYRMAATEGGLGGQVLAELTSAMKRLSGNGSPPGVAVRSSAIDEDGRFASFAGQHRTYLNVVGLEAVLAAVESTWSSTRSEDAMTYRRRHGLSEDDLELAVLVQRMVPADASGVAFSADPVSGRRDRVIVNASWGLGESVVGGTVDPDAWTFEKADLTPLEVRHVDKRRMTVFAEGGTREVDVPEFLRLRPALAAEQALEVATAARDLENFYGWPVDIEFAFAAGTMHLLQCRPVTTLAPVEAPAAEDQAGGQPRDRFGGADGSTTSGVGDGSAEDARYGGLPAPTWRQPDDARLRWTRDRNHFPTAATVLDGSYLAFIERGFAHGTAFYGLPFQYRLRRFWAHVYDADPSPLASRPGTTGPSQAKAAPPETGEGAASPSGEARQGPVPIPSVARDLERHWSTRWLPQIEGNLAAWAQFDLTAADDAAMLAHLEDTIDRLERLWPTHFEIVFAAGHAEGEFQKLYAELFQPASSLEGLRLVQGLDNLTTRSGRAAWRLADVARETPALSQALTASRPEEALAAIDGVPGAEPFRRALAAYLAEYGNRLQYLMLSAPTLAEDPTPVLKVVQDALRSPGSDPDSLHAELGNERERATQRARQGLSGYPEAVRAEFEERLSDALTAALLREDHNYLIDYASTGEVRKVFLECGRRLAESGVLQNATDVLHLTFEEVRAVMAAKAAGKRDPPAIDERRDSSQAPTDLRATVTERRAEFESLAAAKVPTAFEGPEYVPSREAEDERRPPAAAKAAAGRAPSRPRHDTLHGLPGSAGLARGRVRVLATFADGARLEPGEVMVAATTSQPWTPLFAVAAALVTDAGSALTHGAVVAREYRLPAVVGVGNATSALRDGMLVEVDGAKGTVRVIDSGPPRSPIQ